MEFVELFEYICILFVCYEIEKIADTSNTIKIKMQTARCNKSDKSLPSFSSLKWRKKTVQLWRKILALSIYEYVDIYLYSVSTFWKVVIKNVLKL